MSRRIAARGPEARQSQLVVRELEGEVLVYDLERDTALCLNQTAATVWKYCDGERTVDEIAVCVGAALGFEADQQVVWYALDQLSKDHLLEESAVPVENGSGLTRRQLLKRVGVMAAAVPVVTAITAPTAWAVNSCVQSGQPCMQGQICCSNQASCPPSGMCQ